MTRKKQTKHKELIKELARQTRLLRDTVIMNALEKEEKDDDNTVNHIRGFYIAYKMCVTRHISKEEFADMYAQTVTFGLFYAALLCREGLERKKAIRCITRSSPVLHEVFEFLYRRPYSKHLDKNLDAIVELLESIDTGPQGFNKKGKDPRLHFYETFLSEYDPRLRKQRGVYYTPKPVVSFIVRSIHIILKKKLNRPDGLADLDIKVLDPAMGTGTFLVEVARLVNDEFVKKYGEKAGKALLRYYLANNLYGFEIMMAPYALACLNIGKFADSQS